MKVTQSLLAKETQQPNFDRQKILKMSDVRKRKIEAYVNEYIKKQHLLPKQRAPVKN